MKIAVVHQYYLMPGQSGGSRFNEMARLWTEQGHQVTVIAGNDGVRHRESAGRYRGRWVTKEMDGAVTVYRCHVPATYGKSYIGQNVGILSDSPFRHPQPPSAYRGRTLSIATSPPLVAVIPGWIAARLCLRPAPWIFEIRDLWPESAITTGVFGANSTAGAKFSMCWRNGRAGARTK